MKKGIFTVLAVLMAVVGLAQAEDLHGTLDVTYGTKYMWRGFDTYNDKSAIHPSIDLDLFGTGFGFNATGHMANSSGHELNKRWDYTLYYLGTAFENECYQMNYRLGYVYFNYPNRSAHNTKDSIDLQELHGIFSFPNLLGVENLVPTYAIVKLWPANSDSLVGSAAPGTASSFAHIFMLDYAIPFDCPLAGTEQMLNLHSELVYNDGISPNGQTDVDHDWSNAVFGVSTTYDLGCSTYLTPQVYYQISMEDTVNENDELWANLSLTYKF
jgi:hypothetical protein